MTMIERARAAVEGKLSRIEQALRGIEGLRVERKGDRLRVAGRGLRRRWLEDVRLRFPGSGR